MAGQKATFTLDVVSAASSTTVGFDIASSAGKLGIVAGPTNTSYRDGGEVRHTKSWPTGKTVQLEFTLTAPSDPGPLTLYVNALASNGIDQAKDGTSAGRMFDVTVQAPPADLSSQLVDFGGAVTDLATPFDLAQVDAISSGPR